jgi:hypothetical protein
LLSSLVQLVSRENIATANISTNASAKVRRLPLARLSEPRFA